MFEAAARQRQREHGKTAPGKPKDTHGKIATSESRAARDDAAAAFKASPRNVQDAKKVIARGVPELSQAADKGNVAVSTAAKERQGARTDIKAKLPQGERRKAR